MKFTAAEAARLMEGALEAGSETAALDVVSIDSRTLTKGALFFAIVGPHHDGHRFVDESVKKGAAGVVVSSDVGTPPEVVKIRVDDTSLALQRLAAALRRRVGMKVVAITGSTGKTTTKEATAAALEARYRVLRSEGNLNNLYGLPLSILRWDDQEVAVLEMGMSASGEIAQLARIALPDVGILTNVSEVHREFFPSLDAIARAKGELFDELPSHGVAVVNADDPLVLEQARRFAGRRIGFGFRPEAEIRAEALRQTGDGVRFVVRAGGERAEVEAPLYGRHNVYNLLAALGAASALEVPLVDAASKFSALRPAPHRGERIAFAQGFLVIDETYNSNPAALVAALDVLAAENAARRIAVLGDMLELGERTEALHIECGREVASRSIDLLVGVGAGGRLVVQGARQAGFPDERLRVAADADEAVRVLVGRLRPGDVVLLKASRGLRLEQVRARLEEHFGERSR